MYAHVMVYISVAGSTEDKRASRRIGSTMESLMSKLMGSTEEERTMGLERAQWAWRGHWPWRGQKGRGRGLTEEAGGGEDPPVNWSGVPSLGDELRGQVLWGPAQGEGLHARCQPLGKPKVRHLQVSIGVQQQVLRLQIPVLPSCHAAKRHKVHAPLLL